MRWALLLACAGGSPTQVPPADSAPTDTASRDTSDTGSVPAAQPPEPENLLLNPGFEEGTWSEDVPPAPWEDFGDGHHAWLEDDAHEGDRSTALSGSPYAGRTQTVQGAKAGTRYTATVWARSETGRGAGTLKIEFRDAEGAKLLDLPRPFSAPLLWSPIELTALAPDGASTVQVTLVGEGGEPVLFDTVTLTAQGTPEQPGLFVDLAAQRGHRITGLGAQIWAYDWELETLGEQLDALGVTHVRLENVTESATMAELEATEAVLDARGIETVFLAWSAPVEFRAGGMLEDPQGFGAWWADRVDLLAAAGVRPEWIELMNEPDSGGAWSTGISPATYRELVLATRAALDDAGHHSVGVVGPGASALDWSHSSRELLLALGEDGAEATAAFSVHTWDDGTTCSGGASCMVQAWPDFAHAAASLSPHTPIFITEASTKETGFGERELAAPDSAAGGNATWSAPYGVRTAENLLALWSLGAHVPFLWQLRDNPSELAKGKAWGLVDVDGEPKPGFHALATLLPHISPGMELAPLPPQDLTLAFAAVFVDPDTGRTVLGVTRDQPGEPAAFVLELYHCPEAAQVVTGQQFVGLEDGDPDSGVADGFELKAPELSLERSPDSVCTLTLELPPWSVSAVVLETAG